jgi:hypothetical protein
VSSEFENKFRQTGKYEKFNTYETSYTALEVLTVNNLNNDQAKNLMLDIIQPKVTNKMFLWNTDSIVLIDKDVKNVKLDSLNNLLDKIPLTEPSKALSVQLLNKCKTNYENTITDLKLSVSENFSFLEVSPKDINLNEPYIVIEERNVHIYSKIFTKQTDLKIFYQSKQANNKNQLSLITKFKRQRVYTNVSLKGISQNTNWELGIPDLSFIKPRKLN